MFHFESFILGVILVLFVYFILVYAKIKKKQLEEELKITVTEKEYMDLIVQFDKEFPNDVEKIENNEKAAIMLMKKHLQFMDEMENGDYDNKSNSKD